MDFLAQTFYRNDVQTWLLALLVIGLVLVAFYLVKRIIIGRIASLTTKTRTDIDDFIVDLLEQTRRTLLVIVALYLGSQLLDLHDTVEKVLDGVVLIAFFIQIGIWGGSLISYLVNRYYDRQEEAEEVGKATTIVALGFISRVALWTILLLLALDNLGVEITALITGLGIGGIAVGLALQNVLGDLFASLSIVLDKPFVIGDFIIVGDFMGTVEHIGLKTTRLRSLSGEQLVFSNNDLLQSRIRNYKRMYERRVVFSIGVTYQTPYDKMASIPAMLQEIVEAQEKIRFDRAHFAKYGDSALVFEIVYYVLNPDYNLYMDIQQAINLAILRRFEEEGLEFAYPTRTVFIENPN